MVQTELAGTARIEGPYRYNLWRTWGDPEGPYALFCMLNPSTADAKQDDPTIRRCIYFAQREGMDRLCVVNLYAFRATDPAELFKAKDPIGPNNDQWIETEAERASLLIAAWGTKAKADRAARVNWLLRKHGPLRCLRITKERDPGHPLYIPKSAELVLYPYTGGLDGR